MALAQLTDEQTRTWTREEKDRWWLENVYRGDLPQLTIRSGLTGFLPGGVLSATNLYIGGKTGVTLGVNLTSVILAFTMFRFLARIGLAKDFTILENNAMQSIATAAGYMTTPLIQSLAAYMLVTNMIVPWWHMVRWMAVMSLVGVLVAFPLKRKFINEEQLPFPEGRACGVVLDALYHGAAGEGIFKAKLLGITAGITGFYQFLISDGLQRFFQFKLLRIDRLLGWKEPWHFHERLDDYYYMLAANHQLGTPKILGTEFRTLGRRLAFFLPRKFLKTLVKISGLPASAMNVLAARFTHLFFGVPVFLALLSLPLIFILTVICTNSMALTSWTPTGSLRKITQFSIGAIDHTNPAPNLITGGMTAEIASNAGNLLSDIKPGYMLGAKPRQQAIGHAIGIFSGALAATPLFFLLFLPPDANGLRSPATIVSDLFPMPATLQWKGVADLIARGVSSLPPSAVVSMILAAVFAAVIEVVTIIRRKPFPLSSVSIGLGVILPPDACLAMWFGALLFWWHGRRHPQPGTKGNRLWVEGAEPICAGLITGAALVGIANALANVLPT